MKKSELIAKLNAIEGDPEVCIFDHIRNMKEDSGEGSGEGVYSNFSVDHITGEDLPDVDPNEEPFKPWIALGFENLYIDEEAK